MSDDEKILRSIEQEFKPMDRKYSQGRLRVFGRNSTQILNELEKIRRKQISLATEHIALDGVVDNPQQDVTSDEDHELEYQKNVDNFQKREGNLINLMDKATQGDVLTEFSASESVTTEKPLDDPLIHPPQTQNDMSRQYDSMDTVVAPNIQKSLDNAGLSHKPSNSINLGAGSSAVTTDGMKVDNSKTTSNQQNSRTRT
ncbi:hypothetical protein NQZ79_g764 [Umbelopsis isabellina]|nr:hypothetical protein NQZ79_g764 [Umbelopsis isabellina]